MFNRYFSRYPLQNEIKPSAEKIEADKAAVMALIGKSAEKTPLPRKDRTVRPELYEIYVSRQEEKPRSRAAGIAVKAAAAALIVGAGALLGSFIFSARPAVQQPSALSAINGSENENESYTMPESVTQPVPYEPEIEFDPGLTAETEKFQKLVAQYIFPDGLFYEYEKFGVTAVNTGVNGGFRTEMYYNGEKIRYFGDFVTDGTITHCVYQNYSEDGVIDVYSDRAPLNDTDKGKLLGVKQAADEQFAAFNADTSKGILNVPVDEGTGIITNIPAVSSDDIFNELRSKYIPYDKTFDEYEKFGITEVDIEKDGERYTEMYYNGEKIRYFDDFAICDLPGGGKMTSGIRSHYSEDGTIDVYCERAPLNDTDKGELLGVRVADEKQFAALKPAYFRNGMVSIPVDIWHAIIDEIFNGVPMESHYIADPKTLELTGRYSTLKYFFDDESCTTYDGKKVRFIIDTYESDEVEILMNADGVIDVYLVYNDDNIEDFTLEFRYVD